MVVLGVGGTYNLNYCTIANVYNHNIDHKDYSCVLTDRVVDIDKTTQIGPYNTSASIINTIVYGSLTNEIFFAGSPSSNVVNFKNSLLKINVDTFHLYQASDNNCVFNTDPQFKSDYYSNFMPDSTTSPLSGAGTPIPGISVDLFDYNRATPPSIGAIEWHP